MWSIVNYVIILRGVPGNWACSKAEGGGGGLTWPLILRIFGMVSITFFFAPPSGNSLYYVRISWRARTAANFVYRLHALFIYLIHCQEILRFLV